VLDGELTFQLGETLRAGVPGELVFARRGAVHTLANLSERPARYLLVCTPGRFTNYFEQLHGTAGSSSYPETIVVGPAIGEHVTERKYGPLARASSWEQTRVMI
jgi:hypothetical protein